MLRLEFIFHVAVSLEQPLEVKLALLLLFLAARLDALLERYELLLLLELKLGLALEHLLLLSVLPLLELPGLEGVALELDLVCLRVVLLLCEVLLDLAQVEQLATELGPLLLLKQRLLEVRQLGLVLGRGHRDKVCTRRTSAEVR